MDIINQLCPLPLRDYPHIVMGHGAGGKLSSELMEHLFLPAFRNPILQQLGDAALLPNLKGKLAFSTDSYVVRPLFFPGGSIGDLAVNGTVNDLAMAGAKPLYLSAGFILEEGFSLEILTKIVQQMALAAKNAGIAIVAGDTKVVEKGHGDGCYITTAGIGFVDGIPDKTFTPVQPGDKIIVSGTIADHGMAIMSVRDNLEFESPILSDSAPLHDLVHSMILSGAAIRILRDPTRGGLASSLNELAAKANMGIIIDEKNIPIMQATHSACELLGLDPLFVANEGKLVAIVAPEHADLLLKQMKNHPLGKNACLIGQVTDQHPGTVVARTAIGGKRLITMMLGEQLPRIC